MSPNKIDNGLRPDVETVLFDAGGVLVDLDYKYLIRLVGARRVEVTEEELGRYEAVARREIHEQVQAGGRVSEAWRDYFHSILGRAGIPAVDQTGMIDTLWEAHQRFGLWTVPIQHGPQTVRAVKERGFKLGVVSNAEGRIEQDLDAAGYAGLFSTVVDSHVVGVEKPEPRIFEIALERMQARPDSTIFVGDVPSVDVAGAEAAGLTPILLDRHDLYADAGVRRIRSIEELPAILDQLGGDPSNP